MKRRDFLKSVGALPPAPPLSAPAVWSPAKAQSRQETLLFVTESGPNNFDIHGVGTNRPGYEVSWNCYDRLMSHGKKTLPDGTELLRPRQVHARARRRVDDHRHVGHLQAAQGRQIPRRHADHRQGREVVVRPRGDGRRLPDLPDEGGLAGEARAVRRRRRPHLPRRLHPQGPADDARPRGHRAGGLQLAARARRTPTRRIPGASNTPRPTPPAAAPTRWRAGRPAARWSTSATTTGRTARCRRSSAWSGAWCRRPATGAR